MTTSVAPQANLKVNFNNRDYTFEELPQNAQMLLQDLMRLDQQISQLQFELRHLQAAHQLYSASLRKAMNETGQVHEEAGGDERCRAANSTLMEGIHPHPHDAS